MPPFHRRHLLVKGISDEKGVVQSEGIHGTVLVDHGGRPEDDANVAGMQLIDELRKVGDLGTRCEVVERALP